MHNPSFRNLIISRSAAWQPLGHRHSIAAYQHDVQLDKLRDTLFSSFAVKCCLPIKIILTLRLCKDTIRLFSLKATVTFYSEDYVNPCIFHEPCRVSINNISLRLPCTFQLSNLDCREECLAFEILAHGPYDCPCRISVQLSFPLTSRYIHFALKIINC